MDTNTIMKDEIKTILLQVKDKEYDYRFES